MNVRQFTTAALLLIFARDLALLGASQPWRKDHGQWSKEDADRVLNDSPWAQSAAATFPDTRGTPSQSVYDLPGAAQAGLPAPKNAATDGRWDGGVGRNTGGGLLPTLSVLVRWDSSLPVRQALLLSKDRSVAAETTGNPAAPAQPASYVVTVIGLIPAHNYRRSGTLPTQSTSDSSEGTTRPANDTEQVLEGLMANSRLFVRGKRAVRPEDVKIDPETGVIHLFFSRAIAIQREDKEVIFSTRFGSLSLDKRFRLSDMMYQNHLEL